MHKALDILDIVVSVRKSEQVLTKCKVVGQIECGDHTLYNAEVVAVHGNPELIQHVYTVHYRSCRVGAVLTWEGRNPPFTFWGLVGSYDISGDMITGRNVAVLFLDPSNFSDAVIVAVWT